MIPTQFEWKITFKNGAGCSPTRYPRLRARKKTLWQGGKIASNFNVNIYTQKFYFAPWRPKKPVLTILTCRQCMTMHCRSAFINPILNQTRPRERNFSVLSFVSYCCSFGSCLQGEFLPKEQSGLANLRLLICPGFFFSLHWLELDVNGSPCTTSGVSNTTRDVTIHHLVPKCSQRPLEHSVNSKLVTVALFVKIHYQECIFSDSRKQPLNSSLLIR